jgi:PmbA protein
MHSSLSNQPALAHAVKKLEQLNPDQFELYLEKRAATRFESKNQQIDTLSRSEDVGLSIRLLKDKRLGFSYTTSLEKNSIERAIESAVQIASVMPEDPFNEFAALGTFVYPNVDLMDAKGIKSPVAQKIELAKSLEALCRKSDARITAVRSASIAEVLSEVHLIDSSGEHIEHQMTMYSASITCKAEKDGDSQMGGDSGFSNYLDNLAIEKVAKSAALYATELLGAKDAPTLKCPAIFRNSVVADLIEFLAPSFSAENVDKGRSMLAQKKGQLIFAEQITLVDDGLMPGGYATSPFDGEGIPSRKTVLVDGGFCANFLYDGYYAKKFGMEPTGSAQRGIKSPPSIGFNNLYMSNGKKSMEQLCEGISRGIVITDLMGVHTANPVTGDFSLGASGILIENGKLTRPVRGFAVAGNVLDVFLKATDIGNDQKFFGNVGASSVRISEISVSGV